MFHLQDYTNISMALSKVLKDIGISQDMLIRRRRSSLLCETISTIGLKLTGKQITVYHFGSSTEGTNTMSLGNDEDTLIVLEEFRAIPEIRLWKPCSRFLLIVDDDIVTPGYCMLQILRSDTPLPVTEILHKHCAMDTKGRVFLKNTSLIVEDKNNDGPVLRTDACLDIMNAVPCYQPPPLVQCWLAQARGNWPSYDTRRYIASSPCFVVPVASRNSINEELEWRISTSHAERCLMLSLNLTQIQVYVLMKMLSKTFINSGIPDHSVISSYVCKTVLLHTIQKTDCSGWSPHRLLPCLLHCLSSLSLCIMTEKCPHFFIRAHNLFAGRFTADIKKRLFTAIRLLIDDILSQGILSLHYDEISKRLFLKLHRSLRLHSDHYLEDESAVIHLGTANSLHHIIRFVLNYVYIANSRKQTVIPAPILNSLVMLYKNGDYFQRHACVLLAPYLCSLAGSTLASASFENNRTVTQKSLSFLALGLSSDVASIRLKLASVLYCMGDFNKADTILRDIECIYDIRKHEPVCVCHKFMKILLSTRVTVLADARDERDLSKCIVPCVIFLPAEIHIVPKELQYEMFRSAQDDRAFRDLDDVWMDWAVVDSLPYLYFLQYKVYKQLHKVKERQIALNNLSLSIEDEPNLGHKETAMNLLGQCLEQENRIRDALYCYQLSLNIRYRNNVVKYHISRLLLMLSTQKQSKLLSRAPDSSRR